MDLNARLPVFCTHCGEAVELLCVMHDREPAIASYSCPHCQKINQFAIAGEIVEARPRVAPGRARIIRDVVH